MIEFSTRRHKRTWSFEFFCLYALLGMINSTPSFAQNNFMGFLSRFSIPIDLGISGTIFNAKPSAFGDFLLSSGMVGTGVGFEITPDDPNMTWIKPFLRFQVGIGLPYVSAQVTSKLLIENKIYFILGGEFIYLHGSSDYYFPSGGRQVIRLWFANVLILYGVGLDFANSFIELNGTILQKDSDIMGIFRLRFGFKL